MHIRRCTLFSAKILYHLRGSRTRRNVCVPVIFVPIFKKKERMIVKWLIPNTHRTSTATSRQKSGTAPTTKTARSTGSPCAPRNPAGIWNGKQTLWPNRSETGLTSGSQIYVSRNMPDVGWVCTKPPAKEIPGLCTRTS